MIKNKKIIKHKRAECSELTTAHKTSLLNNIISNINTDKST